MDKWVSLLRVDPITTLKKYPDHALDYFIRRDLLEEKVDSIETLWELPEPLKVISKQADQGCWHYPSKSKSNDPVFNYDLFETYRSLRILIDMYVWIKGTHPFGKLQIMSFHAKPWKGISGEFSVISTCLITTLFSLRN